MVLAPRGMLMTANLAQKPLKKKGYIQFFRALGLPSRIVFHATDSTEVQDIKKVMGDHVTVVQAGNLPGRQSPFRPCSEKEPGSLKMTYVGRMHPLKNLSYLLQALEKTRPARIELTVIASMEDREYWRKCQDIIGRLPSGIAVRLIEDMPHEEIEDVVVSGHIFAYATKGENFSHSIFGALSAGRPVLISDQTPWRDLEAVHAGWDLPLDDPDAFVDRVDRAVDMDLETLNGWCRGAWDFAHDYLEHAGLKKAYIGLFSIR
jgi:glycosyltransferase involved in cell wall biosynthesis